MLEYPIIKDIIIYTFLKMYNLPGSNHDKFKFEWTDNLLKSLSEEPER